MPPLFTFLNDIPTPNVLLRILLENTLLKGTMDKLLDLGMPSLHIHNHRIFSFLHNPRRAPPFTLHCANISYITLFLTDI